METSPAAAAAAADEGEMMAHPPAASNPEQQLLPLELTELSEGATEKQKKALTELSEALDAMELLHTKIEMLLGAVGPRRVASDDRLRHHFFAFVKEELSATMVSLRMRFFPAPFWEAIIDDHTAWWLTNLNQEANGLKEFLSECEQKQAERERRRPRHSLLRKPAFCLGPPKPRLGTYMDIIHKAQHFLDAAEDPLRYKHLLLSPSPKPSSTSGGGHLGGGHQTNPSVALVKTRGRALGHAGVRSAAKKLLRWLTSADKSLRVMAIVGPAGVGKTTLAVAVYGLLERQSSQGGHHFQCRAMAKWSRNPDDAHNIHQQILFQIRGTVEPIAGLVAEVLQHKRYFILLDDICTTSDWLKQIKDWFPSNNCGSRILITTRTGSVARCCYFHFGGLVHEMQPLNKLDSKNLLLTKAFGSTDTEDNLRIKNVLDGILRRCGGIPLFIIGMADWLKQHLKQHGQCESLDEVPELLEQFEQALSLTYDELPYMSRLLSLYMSMFPEGYMFDKHHLVEKWSIEWSRQGTLWRESPSGAEQHFLDLVDRNIITRIPKDHSQNLKETGAAACLWQLNYFVLRFLTSKSIEKGFIFANSKLTSTTAAEGGDKTQQVTRRLAHHYHNNHPELPELLKKMDLSQTRSLAISGAADENDIPFEKLTYLVALDLEGWEKLKDEHLLRICKCSMFTLTYLSIRNTRVSKIPRQIYKMYSLKILDISHTEISEVPSEVCKLENLNKLDARSTQIRKLPEEIDKLQNLQHLLVGGNAMINTYETAIKIPVGIRYIHKLETLAIVDVIIENSESSIVDALGDLNSMRVLAITWSFHQCTDEANRSALQSSITKLRKLQSLSIHCGPGCPMEFLGSLSDPPEKLEKFKVTTGKFDSVPQWIKRLNHLVFLQITVCKDMPDNVEILKDLPKLDCLVLGLEFIPTQEIVIGSDGFSELRKFSLDCPVPWLTFRKGAMPKLSCLELKFCSGPAGQRVPSGTINLQELMDVLLYHTKWCKDSPNIKMVVNAVEKEVAKHHKPINLFINDAIQEVERDVNLLWRAVNYLEKRRAVLQPLLLLYCCWLHMPVAYVGW